MAEHLFGITDTGKLRTNNEDVFLAKDLMNGQYTLAGVIDGVGGYEGGEVAAALAKEVILAEMNEIGHDVITQMSVTFTLANEVIMGRKLTDQKLSDMACVATLAVIDRKNNLFHYIHVGDTRLYLFRDNTLVKISHDQSFVGFLEDSGRLDEDAAMQHPKRNEINQALGLSSSEELTESYFETGSSPFLPGDQLLICSDGLTDLVDKNKLTAALKTTESLTQKATKLVKLANDAGGKDNITVVLVKHDKEAQPVAVQPQLKADLFSTAAVTENESAEDLNAIKSSGTNDSSLDPYGRSSKSFVTPDYAASETPAPTVNPQNTYHSVRPVLIGLAVLCLLLVGSLIWLTAKYMAVFNVKPTVVVVPAMNPQEKIITDSMARLQGDTLILDANTFKGLVRINKPIVIERDSLIIATKGQLVFQRDTSYNGAAIVLSPNCKFVKLTDLVFDGFDTAIISYQNVMELKNVRFTHTKHAVQVRFVFPEGNYVNGRRNYQTDTLAKK